MGIEPLVTCAWANLLETSEVRWDLQVAQRQTFDVYEAVRLLVLL
jgi:hypothetical protein